MKINNKIIRLKRFSKSICYCETQQSQRINCLKARKSISLLLALTIILSLFLVAVPMATPVDAGDSYEISLEIVTDGTGISKSLRTDGTGISKTLGIQSNFPVGQIHEWVYNNTFQDPSMDSFYLDKPLASEYAEWSESTWHGLVSGDDSYAQAYGDPVYPAGMTGGDNDAKFHWTSHFNEPAGDFSFDIVIVTSEGDIIPPVTNCAYNKEEDTWTITSHPYEGSGLGVQPLMETFVGPDEFYTSIQDGIDAIAEGGTVNVAAGTYDIAAMGGPSYEPVSIAKPLSLIGAGSSTTVLDATGSTSHCDVIWIRASDVTIKGLTIKQGDFGIRVNNNTPLSNLHFEDMVITENRATGVVFDGMTTVDNVTFKDFKSTGNGAGTGGDGRGIYLGPSVTASDFTLQNTECTANSREGFHTQAISLDGLTITGGKFNDNTGTANYYGSGITLQKTTNAVIDGIEAINNGLTYPSHGVYVKDGSTNVEVKNSTISGSKYGMLFKTNNANANNKATENTITGCEVGLADYNGKGNTHNYNNIANCSLAGVEIGEEDSDSIENIVLNFNSITGNTVGIDNKSSKLVDATKNWWGHESGPEHSNNADGSGDKVSDNVEYFPWFINSNKTTLVQFVTLTKTGPDTGAQGNNITYTITYKNVSSSVDATEVVITEDYPAEVEFISSVPIPPDAGTTNQWTIGPLKAGEEGTIEITVKIK